ncbi:MAG: hypothetical protein H0U53_07250, partial [Actinobacteria bacterium]|nr:hypothetical protein [Actinomycetota bacterium]
MTTAFHIAINHEGESTITIVNEGEVLNIGTAHPHFSKIAEALVAGKDPAPFLSVNAAFDLPDDDRVSVVDGKVFFQGAEQHTVLADTIARYSRNGQDTTNLVRFMERLAANPSQDSREQLFTWANGKGLTIDEDGRLIAFKGVSPELVSIRQGDATITLPNGDVYEARSEAVPNGLGFIVELPREQCESSPEVGCSSGLHAGTWQYASGWGTVVLEVAIDPADVVSVPRDSGFAKLRCCR